MAYGKTLFMRHFSHYIEKRKVEDRPRIERDRSLSGKARIRARKVNNVKNS